LTSAKQQYDESIVDYFNRFGDTKNLCLNIFIAIKDLANLAFNGLGFHLKEKLFSLNQVLQQASAIEN
jgi:hypothetical protein